MFCCLGDARRSEPSAFERKTGSADPQRVQHGGERRGNCAALPVEGLRRLRCRQRDWDEPRTGGYGLGRPRCRFQPEHEDFREHGRVLPSRASR